MTDFIQLHLLTAYPPANLNRDDQGRPKTAIFGGAERLRVSSQALKRAWRGSEVFKSRLDGRMGERTQRLGEHLQKRLVDGGMGEKAALETARKIADVFGKLVSDKDKNPARIEQLAFVSADEKKAAEALADAALANGGKVEVDKTALLRQADAAADIAMFGRMLADDPTYNREAAVQVAHALTTHGVTLDEDYYTAVDDLRTREDSDVGAGFIGTSEFGAGVFYLYMCIDKSLLIRNLGEGGAGTADDALAALIEAAATVGPKGKQASYASRAYASYVLLERGPQQPRSLAAAFLKPVRGDDPMVASVAALKTLRTKMDTAYGTAAEKTAEMDLGADDAGTLQAVVDAAMD